MSRNGLARNTKMLLAKNGMCWTIAYKKRRRKGDEMTGGSWSPMWLTPGTHGAYLAVAPVGLQQGRHRRSQHGGRVSRSCSGDPTARRRVRILSQLKSTCMHDIHGVGGEVTGAATSNLNAVNRGTRSTYGSTDQSYATRGTRWTRTQY